MLSRLFPSLFPSKSDDEIVISGSVQDPNTLSTFTATNHPTTKLREIASIAIVAGRNSDATGMNLGFQDSPL